MKTYSSDMSGSLCVELRAATSLSLHCYFFRDASRNKSSTYGVSCWYSGLLPLPHTTCSRPPQYHLGSQAQEEFARTQAAELDLKRRCSAPVGGDWRLPPALPEDFSVTLDACRPSYPPSIQSQSRGGASSQDSEASQSVEPSQKCVLQPPFGDRYARQPREVERHACPLSAALASSSAVFARDSTKWMISFGKILMYVLQALNRQETCLKCSCPKTYYSAGASRLDEGTDTPFCACVPLSCGLTLVQAMLNPDNIGMHHAVPS